MNKTGIAGSARLAALLTLGLVLAWGCGASKMHADSDRPVKLRPVKVFNRGDVRNVVSAKLGILYFAEPDSFQGIGADLPARYLDALVAKNLFRGVELIPATAATAEGAVWQGRQKQCDYVLAGTVYQAADGSGALPTRLRVGLKIFDTRSGRVVWEVEQEAVSEPGYDVDLYWTTIAGENAQRVQVLERAVAEQFAGFLMEPLQGKGKSSPW